MKAVVMEIKGPDAAVLCEDGTFRKIPDAAYEVGMTVEIADNVLHPKFNKALITAAAAAVILITAAGGSIAYANYAPYRTVTVGDTDYTVNRYNKVLSAYQSGQKVEVVRFQDIEKIVSENEAASAVAASAAAASEADVPSAALPENTPVSSEASENKPVTPVKPQTRISDNQTAAEQSQHESAQEDTQQSQTQQEEQPQETQQPAQKEQPQKTQQPVQKEQPQDTQQPAQKEQPQDTQQPAQKEQPQDTQQPTQKEQSQPDHEVQRQEQQVQEQQVQEQQVQEPDQKTGPADQNMNR